MLCICLLLSFNRKVNKTTLKRLIHISNLSSVELETVMEIAAAETCGEESAWFDVLTYSATKRDESKVNGACTSILERMLSQDWCRSPSIDLYLG